MNTLWQPELVHRRPRRVAAPLIRAVAWGAMAGMVGLGYGVAETRRFALRRVELPLLPAGRSPLRLLHVSDIHMTPAQAAKQRWLRGLAELRPDLVINTGDNLAHVESVPVVLDALGPLLDVPGVFVLGSNDYFAPTLRNPARYLLPDDGRRNTSSAVLPWRELRDGFARRGWVDLGNRRATVTVEATTIALAGVDDPHLGYDDLDAVAGAAEPGADVRLGVTHAPYLRVLDAFARDGYDAIVAGHTHGGQLCLPFLGALVTNCDLETARAKGLHRHPPTAPPGQPGSSWLHVSAGLGTSPYAPVRFCCRPEATLVTLTERRP
jgi:predicted MPP superfamily phosphohydrolase